MKAELIVACLAALAQDTRLRVYRLLVRQGPTGLAAGEIAAQLDLLPATLSFHLKELARVGLLRARQDGRFVFYAADFKRMNDVVAFLTENCCAADGAVCAPGVVCTPVAPRHTRAAHPMARSRKQKVTA